MRVNKHSARAVSFVRSLAMTHVHVTELDGRSAVNLSSRCLLLLIHSAKFWINRQIVTYLAVDNVSIICTLPKSRV